MRNLKELLSEKAKDGSELSSLLWGPPFSRLQMEFPVTQHTVARGREGRYQEEIPAVDCMDTLPAWSVPSLGRRWTSFLCPLFLLWLRQSILTVLILLLCLSFITCRLAPSSRILGRHYYLANKTCPACPGRWAVWRDFLRAAALLVVQDSCKLQSQRVALPAREEPCPLPDLCLIIPCRPSWNPASHGRPCSVNLRTLGAGRKTCHSAVAVDTQMLPSGTWPCLHPHWPFNCLTCSPSPRTTAGQGLYHS